MHTTARAILVDYGVAALAVALALFVRWLLDDLLRDTLPSVPLYGAVAVAVWYGGSGPAVFAALASYLAANYLFVQPRGGVVLKGPADVAGLVAYMLSCAL